MGRAIAYDRACPREEGVVPSRAFDFLAQGCGCGVAAHQIEGELSEYREVLGRIVFPSSVAILGPGLAIAPEGDADDRQEHDRQPATRSKSR